MTLQELLLNMGQWFRDGALHLYNLEILQLTIGQALFTVIGVPYLLIMTFTVKDPAERERKRKADNAKYDREYAASYEAGQKLGQAVQRKRAG